MEYIARIDGGDPKGGAVIYNIRNWTEAGIVADTIGVESCRVIQKLSLDFKTGAVTKTDYLGDVPDDMDCYQLEPEFNYYNHGFDFSGHTLHGGSVVLSPVPTTIFKVPGL
jgi:hypothetical protein